MCSLTRRHVGKQESGFLHCERPKTSPGLFLKKGKRMTWNNTLNGSPFNSRAQSCVMQRGQRYIVWGKSTPFCLRPPSTHENVILWCYPEWQGVSFSFCLAGPMWARQPSLEIGLCVRLTWLSRVWPCLIVSHTGGVFVVRWKGWSRRKETTVT